jgi:hypothetical protein
VLSPRPSWETGVPAAGQIASRGRTTCPRRGGYGFYLDPYSGELKPRRCQAYACPRCGPILALATVEAIVLARPTHSAVITTKEAFSSDQDPEDAFAFWNEAVRGVWRNLRAGGSEWEAVWLVERDEAGRPHVHVLGWGSAGDRGTFQQVCQQAELGWSEIQRIRKLRTIARYTLKEPLRALDMRGQATSIMESHLDLNGRRLLHWTRGFWRDAAGRPLGGIRVARREAMLRRVRRARSSPR